MKIIITSLLSLSMCFCLVAQNKETSISIGYYAPFAVQMGGKIGASFGIKDLGAEKADQANSNQLLISPQFAYFTSPRVHQNYLLNTEIGFKMKKTHRKFYSIPSIGLGYLFTLQNIDGSVDLSSGEISHNKENKSYFLPTVNYELGLEPNKKVGYYLKFIYGRKISPKHLDSAFFGLELGIKIYLGSKISKL